MIDIDRPIPVWGSLVTSNTVVACEYAFRDGENAILTGWLDTPDTYVAVWLANRRELASISSALNQSLIWIPNRDSIIRIRMSSARPYLLFIGGEGSTNVLVNVFREPLIEGDCSR